MYVHRVIVRLVVIAATVVAVSVMPAKSFAQTSAPPDHEHQHDSTPSDEQHAGHDAHTQHQHGSDGSSMSRDGSGTSWLPDNSPMYAIHAQRGPWELMFHENVFLQFLHESGTRGDDQTGSINWAMGMARRKVGAGSLGLRAMLSAEPWTIGGCGYPDLLASGEQCEGGAIHDRQHPHDLFMELSASYDAPLSGNVRWQVYGGPVGEPALGPTAFPHRVSAMPNLLAPISHHWMDSTHITFGVVTGAIYGHRWKAEASVFNGREPDEDRADFDFGALDSVSGRLWLLPTSSLAFQISAGRLVEAEPSENGGPGTDVTRVTASATYNRTVRKDGLWATTLGWGRNAEDDHASNAMLIETSLTVDQHNTWFGRVEVVGKSAHDLAVAEPPDAFTVAKLQAGYTRYLDAWNGFQPGLGGSVSLGIVPDSLRSAYGSRANAGFGVYLTLRPASHH